MPKAEIITIGTEILLGEIVDTNSRHIARRLRYEGIDLYWTSTVGDNIDRIAEAIRHGLQRSEIIITTGGLGPTIDDPTREAVSQAFGVENEYRENLWQEVINQFSRFGRVPTENNKRQAFMPEGAIAINNPVGTAPAFIMETKTNAVIALPGVPSEMEHLMQNDVLPYLRKRFGLTGIIKTRILRTAGVGESQIDALIGDLEKASNPTVGLAAHAGAVDLRITAKAENEKQADRLIFPVEEELRKRLGDWIFGVDKDSLADVAMKNIKEKGWRLTIVESGLNGLLSQSLAKTNNPNFVSSQILTTQPDLDELKKICQDSIKNISTDACLGVVLTSEKNKQNLRLVLLSPANESILERSYGGAPIMAPHWAESLCLNYIRQLKDK